MLELLSPAGCPEAVIAAVQNGADAIYIGFSGFNARRNAKNFTDEEFDAAVRYCRVRGCKVYVTLNTLINDRELTQAVDAACHAAEVGADAILVQDLGLLRALRCVMPDMPIHASTQMSIHNLAGVEAVAEMGIKRAVLARELSLEQIRYIASKSPIELEVFVHGALCFCHSGQCYMSSLIGRRSGNRGYCAQPCRMEYSLGGRKDDYPLSLKDNCLVNHLKELEEAGVKCVKIEGRMKRPEYSAIVTGIYSRAIHEGVEPTPDEMEKLETVFSRQGFTDGYYKGIKNAEMFGTRTQADRDATKLFNAARKEYSASEIRRVPVKFYSMIKPDEPSKFAVEDKDGNKAVAEGPVPQPAASTPLTESTVREQLYKTGGTPFLCEDVTSAISEGLFLPASVINEMRRNLLNELSDIRKAPKQIKFGKMPTVPENISPLGRPRLIFQFTSAEQITPEIMALEPDYVYLPAELFAFNPKILEPYMKSGVTPVAVLPRVITGEQSGDVRKMLSSAYSASVREALVGNMGHIRLARMSGFSVRGDFGLNAFNSDALAVLSAAGFKSVTASFELRISQIRDLRKPLDVEMIAYGRLPLMISDQCIIRNSAETCNCKNTVTLSDRTGQTFPVLREFGCRNVIFNAHKLYMADRQEDMISAGIWGERLLFTNESPEECLRVAESFCGKSGYMPNDVTRGLYYRGVE
jgi:putative protease